MNIRTRALFALFCVCLITQPALAGEKIESIGAPFDPNLHEAVSQIETDEVESQHVAKVIKEGYRFHDTVLRPAMVVVAR